MADYGIVKFFDRREGKMFGFANMLDVFGDETGEVIFIHYYNGQRILDWEGSTPIFSSRRDHLPFPEAGDRLVFEVRVGNKGKKAWPWSFAGRHRPLLAHVARPLPSSRSEDKGKETIAYGEVFNRAFLHFGSSELAHEAASQYQGDFM